MKKLKMMLLSLALFAVVGGALAFKAKFTADYCSTVAVPDINGVLTCPIGEKEVCADLIDKTTIDNGLASFVTCTTFKPAGGCAQTTDCTFTTTVWEDVAP